nr:hypothetical protein [Tanacetum cinerariifolium]
MSWFSRCSWCGGPFNDGNCRYCTNAANLSTHTTEPLRRFNSICYDDDDDYDDEESTIPLNEIVSLIPPSMKITPVLLIMKPEDSLIMRDEDIRTILEKESDKFIKFSIDDLVPIPRESEDKSDSDKERDLPFYDNSMTFSNPLFDLNDDFTSSDDDKVNPVFKEVLGDIGNKDSYVSNIDEPDLLVTPLSDANEDKCFDPSDDVDEIEILLHRDPSTPKMSVTSILEGIWMKKFSPKYMRLPFEDRHYLSLTYVIQIFLPYLTYSMDCSLPLSSGSEDTIFDPGIFAFHFSSLEPVASHRSGTFMCFNVLNESPMVICSSTCFNPNITMIWEILYGESKVHIEVLSVLWKNRLPILDGSVPLSRFVTLKKKLRKSIHKTVQKLVTRNVHNKIGELNGLLRQYAKHQMQLIMYIEQILHSSVKVHRDILVVNAKNLQTKVDKTLANLHKMVELVTQLVRIVDSVAPPVNAATEGEKKSQT